MVAFLVQRILLGTVVIYHLVQDELLSCSLSNCHKNALLYFLLVLAKLIIFLPYKIKLISPTNLLAWFVKDQPV
jgi:hypothetical protein